CFTGPDAADTFTQAFAGTGTTGPATNPNLQEYSFFGQDEWRMRNDLTFNAGLRYDLDLIAQPPTLNPSASLAAAGIFTNRIHNDHANFGPRVGIAWTPIGSKLVVRTGYERSEEHTSELQSHLNLVCRLLLEKKKIQHKHN